MWTFENIGDGLHCTGVISDKLPWCKLAWTFIWYRWFPNSESNWCSKVVCGASRAWNQRNVTGVSLGWSQWLWTLYLCWNQYYMGVSHVKIKKKKSDYITKTVEEDWHFWGLRRIWYGEEKNSIPISRNWSSRRSSLETIVNYGRSCAIKKAFPGEAPPQQWDSTTLLLLS